MTIRANNPEVIQPSNVISQFLSDDGTATGTTAATGNYATATPFWFESDRPACLSRVLIEITDTGNFISNGYGAIASPGLTNGIAMQIVDEADVVRTDLTSAKPVTSNVSWGAFSYDVTYQAFGNGPNFLLVRWSLFKTGGTTTAGVWLPAGWKLRVLLHDDLTPLLDHTFLLQGQYGSAT